MVLAVDRFLNGERAHVERFSLAVQPLLRVEGGKVVERLRHSRMVLTKSSFPDGDRALEERLGSNRVALEPVQGTEQVQTVCDLEMRAPKQRLPYRERTFALCHGLGVLARLVERERLVVCLLRLLQLRIRWLLPSSRACRAAQDYHCHPPKKLLHVSPASPKAYDFSRTRR